MPKGTRNQPVMIRRSSDLTNLEEGTLIYHFTTLTAGPKSWFRKGHDWRWYACDEHGEIKGGIASDVEPITGYMEALPSTYVTLPVWSVGTRGE